MPVWCYQLCDTRDDVKTGMPDNWKVDVYKITSGDSGKQYYVQHVHTIVSQSPDFGTYFYLCAFCPEGGFRAPLGIVGAIPPEKVCKHAENLHAFLEEKRKK